MRSSPGRVKHFQESLRAARALESLELAFLRLQPEVARSLQATFVPSDQGKLRDSPDHARRPVAPRSEPGCNAIPRSSD